MKELLDKIINHKYQEEYLFSGESCAIVGNSSIILEQELGEDIDSHDFVFRFNHAIVKGYEKYVGSKTNIRMISNHLVAAINGYDVKKKKKTFSNFSKDIFKELNETNFISQPDVQLSKVRLLYPHMKFNHITPNTQSMLDSLVDLHPTSGFIGISLALAHFDKVTCVGFDFYKGINDHYFENVVKYDRNIVHSLDAEKEFTNYLRDNNIINFK